MDIEDNAPALASTFSKMRPTAYHPKRFSNAIVHPSNISTRPLKKIVYIQLPVWSRSLCATKKRGRKRKLSCLLNKDKSTEACMSILPVNH